VDDRDTATCVADLIPSNAMLAWVVSLHGSIWLWDSHALSWRLLELHPCYLHQPAMGSALP
jgi:hypothetical protein